MRRVEGIAAAYQNNQRRRHGSSLHAVRNKGSKLSIERARLLQPSLTLHYICMGTLYCIPGSHRGTHRQDFASIQEPMQDCIKPIRPNGDDLSGTQNMQASTVSIHAGGDPRARRIV